MSSPFSFIGAADAYVDVLTDEGVSTGLELKGNCTEFTPKPDSERKEQIASGRDNYGQVLASVTLPKPMTAKVTFNQLDAALFAAAFFGVNTALTQAATPVVDQVVVAVHDKWIELGKYMIGSVSVKHTSGTPTYVLDEDYRLNTRLGMVEILSTGDILDAASLKISYTPAVVNGTSMAAMTKSNVRVRIKLDGQNFADGRNFITDIYQMRLSPTSSFSLINKDFVDVSFEGSLETPTGGTEPMKHIWLS